MEKYLKAVLYAYPLLETVEQDYDIHIKNKAVLSYRNDKSAEELAVYIAEEIIRRERFAWLKKTVAKILDTLSEKERSLLELRYFGKRRKRTSNTLQGQSECVLSESSYFRAQNRLAEKVGAMLVRAGFTKEVYENDFADTEIFQRVNAILARREKRKISI